MSLLIVRGDLQAHSGYSSAIRAYCRLLRHHFERVVGVDIHFEAGRSHEPFPFPLVDMAEARRLAEQSSFALAFSCTTPDRYLRVPDAVNVGMTFWESDRPHLNPVTRRPSLQALDCMDALWTPSTQTRECFESAGVKAPMAVIPWPMEPAAKVAPGLPDGLVYDLDHRFGSTNWLARLGAMSGLGFRGSRRLLELIAPCARNAMLEQLRSSPRAIPEPEERALLCVAQDVPRKGLLLLLSEWLEFKRRPEAKGWSLILKSSPFHPEITHFQFVARFWFHVQALKQQLQVRSAGVYLWTSDLSAADFPRLIASTRGGVACGLGEGFCGPAVQTLLAGKPLVTPRHTAFRDYIDKDYPFVVPTRPARLSFPGDPIGCYDPLTFWNVPEPFGIADALSRLVTSAPEMLEDVREGARTVVRSWCDPGRVGELLEAEIERLARREFRQQPAGVDIPLHATQGGLVRGMG